MKDYERTAGIAILGVLAFLTWPLWLMIAAAKHDFGAAVLLTVLVPLGFTLLAGALLFVTGRHSDDVPDETKRDQPL